MVFKLTLLISVLLLSFDSIASDAAETEITCQESCLSAFNKLQRYARNGSPHAQTLVALSYKSHLTQAEQSAAKAWQWMNIARTQNFAPAYYHTSHWYREGFNTSTDNEAADEHLLRAADLNYSPALYELGIRYLNSGRSDVGMANLNEASQLGHKAATALLARLKQLNIDTDNLVLDDSAVTELLGQSQSALSLPTSAANTSPEGLFNRVNEAIDQQGIYSTKGTTGSHLSNVKCGEPGTTCRIIRIDDDSGAAEGWLLEDKTQ